MKNRIFSIILIMALVSVSVFLAGCSEDEPSFGKEKTFLGGTKGLEIEFMNGEPPEEVYDGGDFPFSITLKINNKGEYDVPEEDVLVSIQGFDAEEFGLTLDDLEKNPDEDITGYGINPDTGEPIEPPEYYVTFSDLNYQGTLSGNHQFPAVANVCYRYLTKATTDLCIKENLLDTQDTSVCTVSGKRSYENSGAPVQITDVEEFTAGSSAVRFSFRVKHIDNNGNIYSKTGDLCDKALANKNKVYVEVDTGMEGTLKCSGLSDGDSGEIILTDGERMISCTQEVRNPSNRIKIVNIELSYDYETMEETEFLVKHNPELGD
jgi:hypothetical protein